MNHHSIEGDGMVEMIVLSYYRRQWAINGIITDDEESEDNLGLQYRKR
jgi:hypothetical protein